MFWTRIDGAVIMYGNPDRQSHHEKMIFYVLITNVGQGDEHLGSSTEVTQIVYLRKNTEKQ